MTNKWVVCPNCGHKFFRVIEASENLTSIEIKCHSCKMLNYIMVGTQSSAR